MPETFDCCVQCQAFWTCRVRAENMEKGQRNACCSSCMNFELCRMVLSKLKDTSKDPIR